MADPLLCLRDSLAKQYHRPTTSEAVTEDIEIDLAKATHLQLLDGSTPVVFQLTTPTRFESADGSYSLRSVYFAWLRRDTSIPDYIGATNELNNSLRELGSEGIQHLPFAEKTDLISWLEGSDESEYIKPLADDKAKVAGAAGVAAGTQGGIGVVASGAGTSATRQIDPQLREIYRKERKTGDRNVVLRGIKPTDFSHVRKHAEAFLKSGRKDARQQQAPAQTASKSRSSKRQDPIILVSPSASSILRMSNIKPFLEEGVYRPPDGGSGGQNLLHISRTLPNIDSERAFRFILVDSPDQFRPDYWNRVVAVFTTGQNWQFKSYKWSHPADLFANVHGIYVGWEGEPVPPGVQDYASGVQKVQIARYNANPADSNRYSDRERAELIWKDLEESMIRKGWSRAGLPASKA